MNPRIIRFAIEAHANTNHLYNGAPYSLHLSMVALYVQKYIDLIPDSYHEIVMDAAWLHDTIEDCRLTYNDIKNVAGVDVADMVYALTNEKGKNRKQRANKSYYEGIVAIPFARYVKLCDRLANVKYSVETGSKMLDVYRKEQVDFLDSIMSNTDKRIYHPLLEELNELLQVHPQITD